MRRRLHPRAARRRFLHLGRRLPPGRFAAGWLLLYVLLRGKITLRPDRFLHHFQLRLQNSLMHVRGRLLRLSTQARQRRIDRLYGRLDTLIRWW